MQGVAKVWIKGKYLKAEIRTNARVEFAEHDGSMLTEIINRKQHIQSCAYTEQRPHPCPIVPNLQT